MVESNTNPNSLAKQLREQAIRQAEDNYKKDVALAVKTRANAINDAITAKSLAVKLAKDALVFPRARLNEARDRIETRLRKNEFEEVRRIQEKNLAEAESARIKAFKQAEILGKRLAAEAAETRKRAIQQAYETEKQVKAQAEQTAKNEKTAARARVEEARKSRQQTSQEVLKARVDAKKSAQSGAAEEREAEQRAAREAAEAKIRAQKVALAERQAQEALKKSQAKLKKEVPVSPPEPVMVPPEKLKSATQPVTKAVELRFVNKDAPKEPVKTVEAAPRPALQHEGRINLIIEHGDADSDQLADFENSLRKVSDVRIVMIGGNSKAGTQILVNADKAVALAQLLKQMPAVEEVVDRKDEILIKLKPVVVFENNA